MIFALRAPAAAQNPLRNAGFETGSGYEPWEPAVYGARPEIALDPSVYHEGAHALRIAANELTDTALGQEIALEPNGLFRLSGWVKTKGLKPESSPVFGTFQVQRPGGRGVLASGANHGADTDWTEVPVVFQAPPDGRVRICIFFTGFGKGTGTAWFDDLKLEKIEPATEPLRIMIQAAAPGTISPFQYGQFIEYLCNLVPGMWAEKLYDGSFEGLTPYQFEFIKETDFKEKPWYPRGEVNRARYSLDRTTKVSGEVSKKIEVEPGTSCSVGLAQDGIYVAKNTPCEFNCWMRAEGLSKPVRVRLQRANQILATCEFEPDSTWKKFSDTLLPNATEANAALFIEMRGPGTLWLDNASLMPRDSVGGWRQDVVEAVRALKPGIIRFGGSAVDEPSMGNFEWKDTIGDLDRRRPFHAWGGLQPTGPGLEEIVQFCRAVGAEPLICVRVVDRAPKYAAEEVEYFNGGTNTAMGAWRARNGNPESYHIRFWQVGNERGGPDYEQRLPAFCQAMKAADPDIRLLSSFPTAGVVKQAGQWLDFVCPHHYSHDLAWMENDLAAARRLLEQYAPGRSIKVGVTEWNTTAGDAGPKRAMLWTLANALACSRYHNLLHRHCDVVEIANRSNLANSFCSGIIQTDNHRLFKTPTYYAQQLYATLAGNRPLKIESKLPVNFAPDVSATLSSDGKEVTLFAVNDSVTPVTRMLDCSTIGFKPGTVSVWTLTDREAAKDPDVFNSFEAPERVTPITSEFSVSSASLPYAFPALSLTVLRWQIEPSDSL
jgi:alpha-N-arabinofuranosidase